MHTLISFLKKVNDPRQTSGKRHPLWLILLLVIMGFMLGYLGYRDFGTFAKFNQKLIVITFHQIYQQKKFRNQTGTRASQGLPSSRKRIYLGCFALSKRDNYFDCRV